MVTAHSPIMTNQMIIIPVAVRESTSRWFWTLQTIVKLEQASELSRTKLAYVFSE